MSSRSLFLVGIAGVGLLSVMAVIGAVVEQWWLVTAAVMVTLGVTCIAAIDADRRIINLRAHISKELKRTRLHVSGGTRKAVPEADHDLLGSVRLLQAQYTARLDRMQASIESSLGQAEATAASSHVDEDGTRSR